MVRSLIALSLFLFASIPALAVDKPDDRAVDSGGPAEDDEAASPTLDDNLASLKVQCQVQLTRDEPTEPWVTPGGWIDQGVSFGCLDASLLNANIDLFGVDATWLWWVYEPCMARKGFPVGFAPVSIPSAAHDAMLDCKREALDELGMTAPDPGPGVGFETTRFDCADWAQRLETPGVGIVVIVRFGAGQGLAHAMTLIEITCPEPPDNGTLQVRDPNNPDQIIQIEFGSDGSLIHVDGHPVSGSIEAGIIESPT